MLQRPACALLVHGDDVVVRGTPDLQRVLHGGRSEEARHRRVALETVEVDVAHRVRHAQALVADDGLRVERPLVSVADAHLGGRRRALLGLTRVYKHAAAAAANNGEGLE